MKHEALLLCSLLAAGCGGGAGGGDGAPAGGPVAAARTRPDAPALYAANCALCHGPEGDGDGSLKLDRPARSFRAGGFSFGNTEEAIYRTITSGIGGTPMPGFANQLDDAQRRELARHVIALGPEQVPGPGLSSILSVGSRPVVVRAHLPALVAGAPEFPRGLLVGNPDGLSYEYRADDLRLLAVRQGPFADRLDWGERGGSPIEPLGRLIHLTSASGEPGAAWLTDDGSPLRAQLVETNTTGGVAILRFNLLTLEGKKIASGSENVQAATVGGLAGYRRSIHLDDARLGTVVLRIPASVIVSQPKSGAPAWYRLREGQQELALGLENGLSLKMGGDPVLADEDGVLDYILLILPDGSDQTWAAIAKEKIQ